MRNVKVGLLCLSTLLIAACEPAATDDNGASSSIASTAQEASSSLPRETANVSYTGVVQPSGISIYMEGTHRLVLEDGRFLLLTAESVDLNDYVGIEVEVHGAIRPTVEGNGMIMRVERVAATGSSASSAVSEASSSSSSEELSSVSTSSSSASSIPSSVSSQTSEAASSVTASSAPVVSNGDIDARAAVMAKEDLAADRWTQRYCSSHIGFCVDIHKNWWYKSFGTTTNALWDLEISSEEIDMPGQGPVKVLLKSGELSGASDGQVKVGNGTATGFRAWTEGRHFEVTAPAILQKAVEMITARIAKSE